MAVNPYGNNMKLFAQYDPKGYKTYQDKQAAAAVVANQTALDARYKPYGKYADAVNYFESSWHNKQATDGTVAAGIIPYKVGNMRANLKTEELKPTEYGASEYNFLQNIKENTDTASTSAYSYLTKNIPTAVLTEQNKARQTQIDDQIKTDTQSTRGRTQMIERRTEEERNLLTSARSRQGTGYGTATNKTNRIKSTFGIRIPGIGTGS